MLKHMLKYLGELDLVFQALSDPTRRVIIERLTLGSASVGELAKPLSMSLPAVYQHLQVLEASGLVWTEKVGRVRTCHLEPKMLNTADAWIEERRRTWEKRLDRLDSYLASLPEENSDVSTARKGNTT